MSLEFYFVVLVLTLSYLSYYLFICHALMYLWQTYFGLDVLLHALIVAIY